MKRGVILLNGDSPSMIPSFYKDDFIVCADGAFSWAKEKGICPNVLLGDFDSLKSADGFDGEILRFPAEKDETDAQLALDFLIEKGVKEILVLGASGKREDHFFGNLQLLLRAKKKGVFVTLLSDFTLITLHDAPFSKNVRVGTTLSLLPFFSDVHIIRTQGLKYEVQNRTLVADETLGISNVATKENVEVEIGSGMLLCFEVLCAD